MGAAMTRYSKPPFADRLFYEHTTDGWIYLYFDYDPTVVEAIKFAVPGTSRRWAPDHRRWEVASQFWPRLQRILIDAGVIGRDGFEEVKAPKGDGTPWAALYLVPGAPAQVVDAVYRALAKLYHPDSGPNGGDLPRMKALNLAYEKLRKDA